MRLYNSRWNGNAPILCCHIPKAMGSWLRKEIVHGIGPERNFKPIATFIGNSVYDEPVWDLVLNKNNNFSVIEGHFTIDSRAILLSSNCFTITSIRDPFEMFWSHIKYISKTRGNVTEVENVLINEKYLFDNPLCRYLSGVGAVERLLDLKELNVCVEKAKYNIQNYFDFIFIDIYLKECCKFFFDVSNGVSVSASEKVNISITNEWYFEYCVFNKACREKYKRFYAHDYLIYSYVKRLFIKKAMESADRLLYHLLELPV